MSVKEIGGVAGCDSKDLRIRELEAIIRMKDANLATADDVHTADCGMIAVLQDNCEEKDAEIERQKKLAIEMYHLAESDIFCCNCGDALHKEDKAVCYMCSLDYHDKDARIAELEAANSRLREKNGTLSTAQQCYDASQKRIDELEEKVAVKSLDNLDLIDRNKTLTEQNRSLVEQHNELAIKYDKLVDLMRATGGIV